MDLRLSGKYEKNGEKEKPSQVPLFKELCESKDVLPGTPQGVFVTKHSFV